MSFVDTKDKLARAATASLCELAQPTKKRKDRMKETEKQSTQEETLWEDDPADRHDWGWRKRTLPEPRKEEPRSEQEPQNKTVEQTIRKQN